MDATNFDRIARFFAGRRLSRRAALMDGGAGLIAGALAAGFAHSSRAQEASPPAGEGGKKTEYLFLQSFQAGRVAPKADAEGRYTLTLEQGLGQTIYFSDRPERVVGAVPTRRFLDGLGFPPDNPPNAALLAEAADGATSIAVIELFSPSYDEATRTATYDVAVLKEWEDALGVGLTETPADLVALGDSFGTAHLFIDDCPNGSVLCTKNGGFTEIGGFDGIGFCYTGILCCTPCESSDRQYWVNRCSETYDDCAGGACGITYDDIVGCPA
jgi:hypothetical protein